MSTTMLMGPTLASEHAAAVAKAQAIMQAADVAERAYTPAERDQIETHLAEARRLKARIDGLQGDDASRAQVQRLQGGAGDTALHPVSGPRDWRPSLGPAIGDQPAAIQPPSLLPSTSGYLNTTIRAAQSEGDESGGGITVAIQHGSFVPRLLPDAVVLEAGPTIEIMDSDTMTMPKETSGTVAAMVAENGLISDSNIVFSEVTLQPRKAAVSNRSSNEWMSDSRPSGRTIVQRNMMREMGRKFDEQVLSGDGVAPNLLGLFNRTDITSTPVSGGITLDAIARAAERIESAGAVPDAIFMSPTTWGAIRILKDGDTRYMLAPDPSGPAEKRLFGIRVFTSPYCGTSVLVSDMSTIVIGIRDRLTVFYDQSRYAEFDQTYIRTTARFDVQVLHAAGSQILTVGVVGTAAKK